MVGDSTCTLQSFSVKKNAAISKFSCALTPGEKINKIEVFNEKIFVATGYTGIIFSYHLSVFHILAALIIYRIFLYHFLNLYFAFFLDYIELFSHGKPSIYIYIYIYIYI